MKSKKIDFQPQDLNIRSHWNLNTRVDHRKRKLSFRHWGGLVRFCRNLEMHKMCFFGFANRKIRKMVHVWSLRCLRRWKWIYPWWRGSRNRIFRILKGRFVRNGFDNISKPYPPPYSKLSHPSPPTHHPPSHTNDMKYNQVYHPQIRSIPIIINHQFYKVSYL